MSVNMSVEEVNGILRSHIAVPVQLILMVLMLDSDAAYQATWVGGLAAMPSTRDTTIVWHAEAQALEPTRIYVTRLRVEVHCRPIRCYTEELEFMKKEGWTFK